MPVHELPPPFVLFRMVTGYYVSRAIHVAAKLGIADLLAKRARGHDELARATSTHPDSLRRVLRLLAGAGVFTEEEDGKFALTPIGACLRSGVPGSMRAATLLFGGITQQAWGDLGAPRGTPLDPPERHPLFDAAGFRLMRIVPTQAPVKVIEGVCA